jgi:hypothetical protein
MKKLWLVWTIFVFLPLILDTATGQQPPKGPKSFSIVLNDSTESMTIEFLSDSEWRQLKVESGKDANIKGDRIRVATNREDKAVITVDLPIQGGKKYRLAWNARASIWDFSPAQ